MLPQEIIRKKRDKFELSEEEIREFISGIINKNVDDAQVAALTMAIFFNSMSKKEITALTLAMRDSGKVLSWNGFDKPIVDKHSSGGVGDKVSLILAPLLAANDVYVPMIAGRGLGHTGGTIDKLESIPNYNTSADDELFRKTVKNVGCAIIGQTADLAPADKKIYAIRDVCATVESIPLITASILSKKLAAGLQYLVMDLKCGNGAFMNNFADAEKLAKSIVEVANSAGTKTSAIITTKAVQEDIEEYFPGEYTFEKETTEKEPVFLIKWFTLDYLLNKDNLSRFCEKAIEANWIPLYYNTLYLCFSCERNVNIRDQIFYNICAYINERESSNYAVLDSFISNAFEKEVNANFQKMFSRFLRMQIKQVNSYEDNCLQ